MKLVWHKSASFLKVLVLKVCLISWKVRNIFRRCLFSASQHFRLLKCYLQHFLKNTPELLLWNFSGKELLSLQSETYING